MLLAGGLAAPALLVAANGAPPAAALDGPGCVGVRAPCVVIEVLGAGGRTGPLHYVGVDDVLDNADVLNQPYPVRGRPASSVARGSSLHRLVSEFVDPADVTFTEVVDNQFAVNRHPLAEDELGPPGSSGFPDGLAPVITVENVSDPHQLEYLRPQRGPDDDNGAQGVDLGLFGTDNEGSLLVKVHTTGHPLDVSVTATPTGSAGRAFAFGSDPTGAAYTFGWVLPDRSTSAEATPAYTFPDSTAATYSRSEKSWP